VSGNKLRQALTMAASDERVLTCFGSRSLLSAALQRSEIPQFLYDVFSGN
jgi:hypothetical protein